jgi:hypothetical protein
MDTLYYVASTAYSFVSSIFPMGESRLETTSSDEWEILDTTSIISEMNSDVITATEKATAESIAYAYLAAKDAAELLNVMCGYKCKSETSTMVKKHKLRLNNMKRVLRTTEACKADAIKTANSAASHLASLVNEYDNSDHSIATKTAIVTATAELRVAIMDVKRANSNVECARNILAKYQAHTSAY